MVSQCLRITSRGAKHGCHPRDRYTNMASRHLPQLSSSGTPTSYLRKTLQHGAEKWRPPLLTSIYSHHLYNMAPKYARRTIPRHTSIYRHNSSSGTPTSYLRKTLQHGAEKTYASKWPPTIVPASATSYTSRTEHQPTYLHTFLSHLHYHLPQLSSSIIFLWHSHQLPEEMAPKTWHTPTSKITLTT